MSKSMFTLIIASALGYSLNEEGWAAFKEKFGKTYNTEDEDNLRIKIYQENKIRVDEHNKLRDAGLKSYSLTINKFSDLTFSEFNEMMNGFRPSNKEHNGFLYVPTKTKEFPASVDWRTKGAVTPVKNQGNCGSCWAFSTTGALEGQTFLKNNKLVSFSEQNLVDCDSNDQGCGGGDTATAYDYIIANKGLDSDDSYPYEGEDNTCRFKSSSVGVRITGYNTITPGNESALQAASAHEGPISVCINAVFDFMLYKNGVYYNDNCPNEYSHLNHCVLVVGYGTENGVDFWLVKNSWGADWGEQGYIKMSRGKNNNCGVATEGSYPLVVKS